MLWRNPRFGRSDTLENSLRIIEEVQSGHKESQAVLLQRITCLESSLSAAQDSELSMQLAERDAENSELQAAVEELEEEMRREVEMRDVRLSDSEERIKDLEAQLAAKDCLLNAAQVTPLCRPTHCYAHCHCITILA